MTAVVAHSPTALDRLGRVSPQSHRYVVSWLLSLTSVNTRDAYRRDIEQFVGFLLANGGEDLLEVRRVHIDAFARYLENTPLDRTGKPPAATTRHRKLAAVSSFYTYLVEDGRLDHNPAEHVKRPRVDWRHSTTTWLTEQQGVQLIRASADYSPRACALVMLLLTVGLRISEACNLDVAHLGVVEDVHTIQVTRKGDVRATVPIPAVTFSTLAAYIGERIGPLFITDSGRRMSRQEGYRIPGAVARRAGLPFAEKLSPHSLRHTCASTAIINGQSLSDVQDLLGHADPRTTERYRRARRNLHASPVHMLGAKFAAGLIQNDNPRGDDPNQAVMP